MKSSLIQGAIFMQVVPFPDFAMGFSIDAGNTSRNENGGVRILGGWNLPLGERDRVHKKISNVWPKGHCIREPA